MSEKDNGVLKSISFVFKQTMQNDRHMKLVKKMRQIKELIFCNIHSE